MSAPDTEPVGTEPAATTNSLDAKLAKIAGELSWVGKTGYNEVHKYNYVKAEVIANEVRGKLSTYGISFNPSSIAVQVRDSVTGKQHVTTVEMRYELVDSETGQSRVYSWFGAGADSGDKGLAKAKTSAKKTFFIDLFQIPTGQDPDQEVPTSGRAKAADAKLSPTNLKRVLDAVIKAGVTDDEWTLFLSNLRLADQSDMTAAHAKQVRAWLDERKAKAKADG